MKKILCLLLFAILWVGILPAQKLKEAQDTDKNILNAALKGWRMRISAGFNIGGCAPLPLPREIRSIDGYHPGLNFALEGDVDALTVEHGVCLIRLDQRTGVVHSCVELKPYNV